MADYEKLYHKIFNEITEVIERLKSIQQEAEEDYILACEEDEVNK